METIKQIPDINFLKKIQIKDSIENAINEGGNPFPIEVFPKEIQTIIKETEKLNFCPDYIGGFMLGVISSAIGNTCKIQFKRGYLESSILFLCVVGNPGTNKSAPLKFAVKPFQNIDSRYFKDYKEEVAKWMENDSKKPAEREDMQYPQLAKKIISDATMEAIQMRHQHNTRGLTMVMDELAGFFNNMGRYNKGSELEQWLSIFSGHPITVDRKKGEPLMIENPHISIIGGIQPGVFHSSFSDKVSNGMTDRFLICIPEVMPIIKWNDNEIEHDIYELWDKYVKNILGIPLGEEPNVFHFSKEAKAHLIEWQNNLKATKNPIISGVDAKLSTYVLRFSLILHIMKDAINSNFPSEVQTDTVSDAIKLYNYFRYNAIAMRQDMKLLNAYESLEDNKKELFKLLPEEFIYSEGKDIMLESNLMKESTFKLFLKNNDLFSKPKQGTYKKILQ